MRVKKQLAAGVLAFILAGISPVIAYADGWNKRQENGKWIYEYQGKEVKNSWQFIDGMWYFFNENGEMQTGWIQLDGIWYFLHADGSMGKGWVFTGDTWYYLGLDGRMQTGWIMVDGNYYYLDTQTGAMLSNTYTPDGYWVDTSGVWSNGLSSGKRASSRGGGGGGGGGGGSHARPSKPDEPVKPDVPPPVVPDIPVIPDIPDIPVVPDIPEEPEVTYFAYTVKYLDIESGEVLGIDMGQGEQGTEIEIEYPVIEGYILCEGQPERFILSKDGMEYNIYYDSERIATPGEATMVPWTVRFVDEENHNYEILKSLTGESKDGEELTVSFPGRIKGKDGYIWDAATQSPWQITVSGHGLQKYLIEYKKAGEVEVPKDPDQEARDSLTKWNQKASVLDYQLTGEDPGAAGGTPWIVTNRMEAERRIQELVSMIEDTDQYYFYLIGMDYDPATVLVGEAITNGIYSHTRMDTFTIEGKHYYVELVGISLSFTKDSCQHAYEITEQSVAGCLTSGIETVVCKKCGTEEQVVLPPLGHEDKNGDSVCDRCNTRAFPQKAGDKIQVTAMLEGKETMVEFICLDEDYEGGMLYLAADVLQTAITPDTSDYNKSSVRSWLNGVFANELSVNGCLVDVIRMDGDRQSDYAFLLSKEELVQYQASIPPASKGYLTRSHEDNNLFAADQNGVVTSVGMESVDGYGLRPAIVLDKADPGVAEAHDWQIGDIQARDVNGRLYLFRCIDDDYPDSMENQERTALFLCDSIIRSDIDSTSSLKTALSFGTDNNYKKSRIREWLNRENFSKYGMFPAYVGVNTAYTGSTGTGTYEQLDEDDLTGTNIDFQLMQDTLFCLSVEEALRYKDYLWRFNGSSVNNPDSQYSRWSKGYWLRTPSSYQNAGGFQYGKEIYVVDTVNGNIHPADVSWTSVGIRPAFTMPQS